MLTNYLALDVGQARIGLAVANSIARLAAPLPALAHDANLWAALQKVTAENSIQHLVVGLPRGMDGQVTDQTRYSEEFAKLLESTLKLPVSLQDEALTSIKAKTELTERRRGYSKGDVDSLSAVYILEDFLVEAEGVN